MFDYQVMSKDDAEKARFSLLTKGKYHGVISAVEPKISNSGNHMLVINVSVYDSTGLPTDIRDYLVMMNSMMWKFIHCCEATGLLKEYEDKTFKPEMLLMKNVIVDIDVDQGKEIPQDKLNGKAPGSKYPSKNVIVNYSSPEEASKATDKPWVEDVPLSDDIPF